jgi:hypothetical protein
MRRPCFTDTESTGHSPDRDSGDVCKCCLVRHRVATHITGALYGAQSAFEYLDPAETVGFALRDLLTGQGYLKSTGEPN